MLQCSQPLVAPFSKEEEDQFFQFHQENVGWALAKAYQRRAFDHEETVNIAMGKAMVKYRPEKGKFCLFLARILNCELVSDHRYRKIRQTEPLPDYSISPEKEESVETDSIDLQKIIDTAVSRLEEKNQLLFELYYEENLRIKDIAQLPIW